MPHADAFDNALYPQRIEGAYPIAQHQDRNPKGYTQNPPYMSYTKGL
jgi:hypothetical protein